MIDSVENLRRATAADLPQTVALWHAAEHEDDPNPPPLPAGVPPGFRHEFKTGEMWVAERAGAVVGYGALIARDGVAYLSSLFVRGDLRSGGVGRRLLERILPRDGRACFTLSSTDPSAKALYIRAGMRPGWSEFSLRAETARLAALPAAGVEVVAASPGDPALLDWDAEIGGRRRPEDHAFWLRERAATPLWFQRAGETVGYGYVAARSDVSLATPSATTIGPLGARTEADALACAFAAVEWARGRAAVLRVDVPGPHPALAPLLDAGFHIVYVETFHSSAAEPFTDVRRYLPSGSGLF